MLRLDRTRTAGPWLEWKVRLFTVGAVLALGGMYLDESWVVGAAMVVLVMGMLVRFLPAPGSDAEGERQDGADRDGAPPPA